MTLQCILLSESNYAWIVGKGKIIGDRDQMNDSQELQVGGDGLWETIKLFCVETVVVDVILYAFVKTQRTVYCKKLILPFVIFKIKNNNLEN